MIGANSAQAGFCDLNGDGAVNSADIQIATNAAIGLAGCIFGDLNGDGVCDVVDLQRVINAALGAACRTGA
jgi:copper homeostasis protein CutC